MTHGFFIVPKSSQFFAEFATMNSAIKLIKIITKLSVSIDLIMTEDISILNWTLYDVDYNSIISFFMSILNPVENIFDPFRFAPLVTNCYFSAPFLIAHHK